MMTMNHPKKLVFEQFLGNNARRDCYNRYISVIDFSFFHIIMTGESRADCDVTSNLDLLEIKL